MRAIFLDIESNGLNFNTHSVLEIAFKIVDLSSCVILAEYNQVVNPTHQKWLFSDLHSLAVNGFSWSLVEQGKSYEEVGQEIQQIFATHKIHRENSVFICQNPSFDRSFFSHLVPTEIQERKKWPYHWLDLASMFMSKNFNLFKENNSSSLAYLLSKDHIAKKLGLPPEAQPHRAIQGVDHLIACYFKLFNLNLNESSAVEKTRTSDLLTSF